MRRDLKILVGTVLIGVATQWGHLLPAAVTDMETFRVTRVEVQGTRYLSESDVIARLALAPNASVWSDTGVLVERLRSHPMILDARVVRRAPHGLLVDVTERRPIALAATPTLEPVDAHGHRLPIDPAVHRLDLPIIASSRMPPDGSMLFPEDVRELASELDHLMSTDTAFLQRVSSVRRTDGTLVVRWTEPPVEFLLPDRAPPSRLREGLGALASAITREPGNLPDEIDLRFADQVVVRRSGTARE